MATHSWGIERLRRSKLDQHILLLVEDWNEPDSYEVGESSILVEGAAIVVASPVEMRWVPSAAPTDRVICIVLGTYIGEELKTTTIVDRNTGQIAYAPEMGEDV